MNYTVYIFGELSDRYDQYPFDSSSGLIQKLYSDCKVQKQLVIHRDGVIMNYYYFKKINNNKYIGLGVTTNTHYLIDINYLFSVCEDIVAHIAEDGIFVKYKNDGMWESCNVKFSTENAETNKYLNELSEKISTAKVAIIPPIDFSVSCNSIKICDVDDPKENLAKASYTYGFTIIYAEKEFCQVRINNIKAKLNTLTLENSKISKEKEDLTKKLKIVQRQKKQTIYVFFLVIVLLFGGGISYNKIQEKNKSIINKEDTIKIKETQNGILSDKNNILNNQNLSLKNSNINLTTRYEDLAKKFNILQVECNNLQQQLDNQLFDIHNKEKSIEMLSFDNKKMKSKIFSLESKQKGFEAVIKNNESRYNILQREYNRLKDKYYNVRSAYYSTKEGKKELRRNGFSSY